MLGKLQGPRAVWLAALLIVCIGSSGAQTTGPSSNPQNQAGTPAGSATAPQEHKLGDYVASQSVEFGYRFNEISGAKFACPAGSGGRNSAGLCEDFSMYDTLENYHTGPRLLQQSLSLRAPAGTGGLFDDLSLDSFGFGGDPNNVARLHVDKSKWYRLDVNFRRDQNFFNYDLLANPLNPPATGNIPILYSPHYFYTVRRMSDVDVSLAPQSKISLRLGYNRNRMEGPASSTFHMPRGTDIKPQYLLNTTSDTYRAGIDFKLLPRTTISYDQFYTHFKGDNAWDNTMFPFLLSGSPIDLGISWNLDQNQPCSPANLFGPRCNLDQSFVRQDRYRTNMRTEQLSFRSQPSSRVDLDGRVAYSSASMGGLFSQAWTGFAGATSTRQRQDQLTSVLGNRLRVGSADLGITIHLTDRLRVLDTLRWVNSRAPLSGLITDKQWLGPKGTTVLTPVGDIAPVTLFSGVSRFWKFETKQNQAEVEYDFTRTVGASVGYRYERRYMLAQDELRPLTAPSEGAVGGDVETGVDNAELPIHAALLGIWLRPNEKLRASLDTEFSSAGLLIGGPARVFGSVTNVYGLPGLTRNAGLGETTRITPRKEQRYRLRLNHNPRRWMTMGISANIWNARNDYADVGYRFHSTNAGFNTTLLPNDRFSLDLAYNFNTYRQSDLICPIDVPFTPSFISGASITSPVCPFDVGDTGPTGLFQTFGRFESVNHFFYALVRAKVAPRLTASLGYSLSAADGAQVFTNPLLVAGSLKNDFHRPLAELQYDLSHGWAAKAAWNYYGYGEQEGPGPTLPRNFHANSATVSTIYSF